MRFESEKNDVEGSKKLGQIKWVQWKVEVSLDQESHLIQSQALSVLRVLLEKVKRCYAVRDEKGKSRKIIVDDDFLFT
jgi:hypothetical protein